MIAKLSAANKPYQMKNVLTALLLIFLCLGACASPVVPHPRPLPIDKDLWSPSGLLISFRNTSAPPLFTTRVYPYRLSDDGYFQTTQTGTFINQTTGVPFDYTLMPGDEIAIKASEAHRTYLSFENVHGTAQNHITILAEGGTADVEGISLTHCSYVDIIGTFDMTIALGSPGQAITVTGRSRCIEVMNCSVYGRNYGAWIKTDPSCVDSTNYPNWIIDSVKIHDCSFRRIGQDVIYAGNTLPNGTSECGVIRYPMHLKAIELYNLTIDSANRTGIQISECHGGSIHNCTISNVGFEYKQNQGVGISVGGQSFEIHVYNNTVKNSFLYGLLNLGKGRNYFENNTVDSSGFLYIQPFIDIDSLIAALDAVIASDNPASGWNTGTKHLRHSGRWLINTFSQPSWYYMQPDNDVLHDPTLDSSTCVVRGNKGGATVVVDGSWNYIGGNQNKIVLKDLNRNPYGWYNYICGNTLLDGTTPADIAANGKHYFTDCSGFDPPVFHHVMRIPSGGRLTRKH
jgi:hypothetical protein